MMCKPCQSRQDELLEDDCGTQIVCEHDVTGDDATAAAAGGAIGGASSSKRKFLSRALFAELGGDKIKRKISPVQAWSTLNIRAVYLVRRVVSMEVTNAQTGAKEIGHYAEMVDEAGDFKKAWLTEIILKELKDYCLAMGMFI